MNTFYSLYSRLSISILLVGLFCALSLSRIHLNTSASESTEEPTLFFTPTETSTSLPTETPTAIPTEFLPIQTASPETRLWIQLQQPVPDAIEVDVNPVFVWESVGGVLVYQLVIRQGEITVFTESFDANTICFELTCVASVPLSFASGQTYTWFVRALNTRIPIRSIRLNFTTRASTAIPLDERPIEIFDEPMPFDPTLGFVDTQNIANIDVHLLSKRYRSAATVKQLRDAMVAANNLVDVNGKCRVHMVITLTRSRYVVGTSYERSNTFGATAFPRVRCPMTINGNNATIERSQTVATGRMRLFFVFNNGYLRLNQVNLRRGFASLIGGSAVLNYRGTLHIHQSNIRSGFLNFSGNYQTLGAGVYSYFGRTTIEESVFLNNTNSSYLGDGGAIAIIGGGESRILRNRISGNLAKRYGNAIYLSGGENYVRYNCLSGNVNPTSTGGNLSLYAAQGLAWQEHNWWGNGMGALLNQPATLDRDSTNVNTFTPFQLALPPDCTPDMTGIQFDGAHANLKSAMFWAIFNETSSDNFDSGSPVDDDLTTPRYTRFLVNLPYCVLGAGIGDNAAEPPNPNDWHLRHCPYDHRYMSAQTMINGFLNYEREAGLNLLFNYLRTNFPSSLGEGDYSLWTSFSQCRSNSYGTSYSNSLFLAQQIQDYNYPAGWLAAYLQCMISLDIQDYTIDRVKRAYNTIMPQIESAINHFYLDSTYDYTRGAFGILALNFGENEVQLTCVGRCYRRTLNGANCSEFEVVHSYSSGTMAGRFCGWYTPVNNLNQGDFDDGYQSHMTQISTYNPRYPSVVMPVIFIERPIIVSPYTPQGYTWLSIVYQRSQDMSHYPR